MTKSSSDRVKASMAPATMPGGEQRKGHAAHRVPGAGVEVARRLLHRAADGGEPARHDEGHEADLERHVGDDHGRHAEAQAAEHRPHRLEGEEHAHGEDDVRGHDGHVDHGVDGRAQPPRPREALEAEGEQGAEHGGRPRVETAARIRVFAAADEHDPVRRELGVPAQREALPRHAEPRRVQRQRGHGEQRQVQEHEGGDGRGGEAGVQAPLHGSTRSSPARRSTISPTSVSKVSTRLTAAPKGKSRLTPNWCWMRLPSIHCRPPPSRSGMTKAPMAGMKVRITAVTRPGRVWGRMACRNTRTGPAYRSRLASTSAQSSFSTLV